MTLVHKALLELATIRVGDTLVSGDVLLGEIKYRAIR